MGTVTTPTFHTAAAGETLVAFVASDGPGGTTKQTVTVSGAGLTWTLVKRNNTRPGDAEVWTAKGARHPDQRHGHVDTGQVRLFAGPGGDRHARHRRRGRLGDGL